MNDYQNIRLDKGMYKAGGGFTGQLEALDPSPRYAGTELAGLDAFQRQLKRFDIKVGGSGSDAIEKFFSTADSAALFPEYVSRAVGQGMEESEILSSIIATKTNINSMDYRTISTNHSDADLKLADVVEGGFIPQTTIKLKEQLVTLKKRGRMLVASYEAIKFQRLDLFTVTLRQIGSYIARSQLRDAVEVLISGDGSGPAADTAQTAGTTLAYSDLVNLWNRLGDYKLNTLLASPDMAVRILNLPEFISPAAGADFHTTGRLVTPMGATLISTSAVPAGTVVGLDRRYALEMVTAGDVNVDYDKLIDCQLERAAITSIAGFSKIFPDAVKVMTLKQ